MLLFLLLYSLNYIYVYWLGYLKSGNLNVTECEVRPFIILSENEIICFKFVFNEKINQFPPTFGS